MVTQMFQIISFFHELVSGHCDVKIRFCQIAGGHFTENTHTFSCKGDAEKWLEDVKKMVLLSRLTKFVDNLISVIENSDKIHKSHKTKLLILDDIKRYAVYAKDKPLNEVCHWMKIMEERFRKVLPPDKHPKWMDYMGELNHLIHFAREQTKGQVYPG